MQRLQRRVRYGFQEPHIAFETIEEKLPDRSAIWRGQLFMFNEPKEKAWSAKKGLYLLAIVALLELLIRPLFTTAAGEIRVQRADWYQSVSVLIFLIVGILLTIKLAKVNLADLGLAPWRNWSAIEKHFFIQTLIITIVIFSSMNLVTLKSIWLSVKLPQNAVLVFLPEMVWGFYQEFLYRGLLQSELVRRFGPVKGILVTNTIFTFGPLHFYHFSLAAKHPGHLWIFAGIFAIGLYFSILYHRSGNLWTVGILHGLGDFFLVGLKRIYK